MTEEDLKLRFKAFALRIMKMVDAMPKTISSLAIAKQIVRSGISPSANYRAACLGKSKKDFLNKLKFVEEELDETAHWLELIIEGEILPEQRVRPLYDECIELLKITISSITSTRKYLSTHPQENSER